MLRKLLALLVFGMSSVSITAVAVAQEDTEASASDQSTPEAAEPTKEEAPPTISPPAVKAQAVPAPVSEAKTEAKPDGAQAGWTMEVHGYFRAPLAIGISSRPDPGSKSSDAAKHLQLSYGPSRVMDWNYYSFAYTRLQEQDWAEVTFHAKRKHVDAVVGMMGYWLAATGLRNPDAQQFPGIAYLKLDSDVEILGLKPNVALTMGAFWPGYGYFEKYDTFTLGRFRHIGEQLKFTVPVTPELTITLEQGFGAARDGKYDYGVAVAAPKYATVTGNNMVAYGNLRAEYLKYARFGLHYNYEWTRDPTLTQGGDSGNDAGKTYTAAREAYMSVIGAELNLSLPLFGRLWISPSLIKLKNGWALSGDGGTEVLHSMGGAGIAYNYLGFTNSTSDSTGTGSVLNVGFTYENSLSNILPDFGLPDVKVSVFGLIARASLDLPETKGQYSPPSKINQYKWGADATVLPLTWLAVTGRWDTVSLLDRAGYVFSAITARVAFFSHFLSSESIFLQFSRYKYGDKMVLAAQYPWGSNPIVVGSDVFQNRTGGYGGKTPDESVIKLQAQVTF